MAGDNAKYVVEFQAEIKKLRQALSQVNQIQKNLEKDNKANQKAQLKYVQQHQKSVDSLFKKQEKARKQEKSHIQLMSREETKRAKQQMTSLDKLHKQNLQLTQRNTQLQQRAQKKAEAEEKRGGRLRRFVGGVGAAVGGIGLAGMGLLIGAARSGYEKYMEYGQTMGRTIGLGNARQIRAGMSGAMGSRLGFSRTETAAMVPLMGRSTGVLGPRELQQAMRATGMEGGEAGESFGVIRRAGFSFEGAGRGRQSAGGREFQKQIALGMASGIERARLPEYFQGVNKLVEEQRAISTGVINVGEIAKQLTRLGMGGAPGLQGAAGAQVLDKFAQALRSPGGGEFGEMFVRQSMGFGTPGGNTSFYQAEKMRERGVNDPQNVQRIMSEIKAQFGTGPEGNLALRELTGVSLDQAEKLQEIYNSGESSEEKLKKIEEVVKESDTLEKQSLDAMKGIGHAVERIATLTNRGINMGEKVAPLIEKLEDWEYQGLQYLMQMAGDVHEIVDFIKEKFGDKTKLAEKSLSQGEQLAKQPLSADPVQRRQQILARRALENRAEVALGEKSIFSDYINSTKQTFSDVANGTAGIGDIMTMSPARKAYAKRKSDEALLAKQNDAQRALELRNMRITTYQKMGGGMSPDVMRYLNEGGEVPDEVTQLFNKNRKTTASGTVSTPAPSADAAAGKSKGADTSTSTGTQAVRVTGEITVQQPDARTVQQKATVRNGIPKEVGTR